MDPTANLAEQLELALTIVNHEDGDNAKWNGERLAELVLDLNEWISKGGFLPAQWTTEFPCSQEGK